MEKVNEKLLFSFKIVYLNIYLILEYSYDILNKVNHIKYRTSN